MPKIPEVITVDYETIGIENRPHYPPSPVSVSIKHGGKPSKFYSWGHAAGGNNCTWGQAREALGKVWADKKPKLFQNAKFDLCVSEEHMDLPPLKWDEVHDSLFLIYLDDPRTKTFSLKPTAERILRWPPEEQDAVMNWLIEHQPIPGIKLNDKKGKFNAAKYIAYAPGDIVGAYADGDTDRTFALFEYLYTDIVERGMLDAYNRERRLLPILMEMERNGVQVDYKRLSRDCEMYSRVKDQVTAWCVKRLGMSKVESFNIGSDAQLLKVLLDTGKVDETLLLLTAKGKHSASKESLHGAMNDKALQQMLAYLSELSTCLNTFMLKYLHTADQNEMRRIYTDWNQVRQDRHGAKGTVGTSTGRLSSTPNFQNISNKFDPHFKHLVDPKMFETDADYKAMVRSLPKCPLDLPFLPLVRSYITAFPGEILIDRDYSQQELRILGHYEGGPLTEAYNENPWLDVHNWARGMINEMLHTDFARRPIKDMGFGLIYGMGLGKLAIKSGTDVATSKLLKKSYLDIAPGIKDLYTDMRKIANDNESIRTWGGREYYCEEPKLVNGRMMKFDYKMINLLIQGSAAECTKEAIIRYSDAKPSHHHLVLNVHDQLTSSVPKDEIREGMEIMRETMESIEFDIPMLTEGEWSDTNWDKSSLMKYDDKGVILYNGK